MPSVSICFRVHQPFCLRNFSFLDLAAGKSFEDSENTSLNTNYWADNCYLLANSKLRELVLRHKGNFRVAFHISGLAIQQWERYRTDVLKSFANLAWSNCTEFLGMPYYHSMSFMYSKAEFLRQIRLHSAKMRQHFEQEPMIFANPELMYSDVLGEILYERGCNGIMGEGDSEAVKNKSAYYAYTPKIKTLIPTKRIPSILQRNMEFSDLLSDILARRRSLSPADFVDKIRAEAKNDQFLMLYVDYELLLQEGSMVFALDFLDKLSNELLKHSNIYVLTPSMVVARYLPQSVYSSPQTSSRINQSISQWNGNFHQTEILQNLYEMESAIMDKNSAEITEYWAKLQTLDYLDYLNPRIHTPQHSPFATQHEAFLGLTNMQTQLQLRLRK